MGLACAVVLFAGAVVAATEQRQTISVPKSTAKKANVGFVMTGRAILVERKKKKRWRRKLCGGRNERNKGAIKSGRAKDSNGDLDENRG